MKVSILLIQLLLPLFCGIIFRVNIDGRLSQSTAGQWDEQPAGRTEK